MSNKLLNPVQYRELLRERFEEWLEYFSGDYPEVVLNDKFILFSNEEYSKIEEVTDYR